MRLKQSDTSLAYLLLTPALLLMGIFFIYPIIMTFVYSFTDYDGYQKSLHFIGFNNFFNLFTDDKLFWSSLKHNLVYALILNTIGVGFALALALSLNNIRGKNFYRMIFFMPVVISVAAAGYIWSYLYEPTGIINSVLAKLNITGPDWLGDSNIALYSVILVDMWKNQGMNMILFLAGLQTIPSDLYEAAEIDSANSWQKFRHITWPLLTSTTKVVVLLTMIGSIKTFDLVFVMTNGGPAYSTDVITTRIFKDVFGSGGQHYFGYASAGTVILFFIIFIVSLVQMYVTRGKEVEY